MTAFLDDLIAKLKAREPVAVVGGESKPWLGGALRDTPVSMREYSGVLSYEPTELVLTARAGTPLAEIEHTLAQSRQMLPFEPPVYSEQSTLGGVMASGLSGPRRMHLGSARDAVLGVRLLNGLGQHVKFGGEVMKNVAGYDLSRLSVGALGTLGILTEISVKVLPVPEREQTQVLAMDAQSALTRVAKISRSPYPVSAATWVDGQLYIRISGAGRGVASAAEAIGGDTLADAETFWRGIRNQTHPAFQADSKWLWRLSVPPTTPMDACPGVVVDWAGGQRWLHADADDFSVFDLAAQVGGHATCFAASRQIGTGLQPLETGIARLNARVRDAMDPYHLINRGRMFEENH